MTTKAQVPRTAAEINTRRQEIGAELAKGRITPVANARELEAEDDRLRIEYRDALEREAEANRDAETVRVRVAAERQRAREAEREKRVSAAVAAELGR